MATVNFFHVCDSAILSQSNNLSIINIFDTVTTSVLPVMYPRMTVLCNLSFSPGKEKFTLKVSDPDLNDFLKQEFDISITPEGSNGGAIIEFFSVLFEKAGTYTVEILKNGEAIKAISFKVIKK